MVAFILISVALLFSTCSELPEKPPVAVTSILESALPQQSAPQTFSEAKIAAWKIFEHHPITFYCGCHFYSKAGIQRDSCPYRPTVFNQRTFRVEWEHIVPAKRLGQDLACWHQKKCRDKAGKLYKGRACCVQQSPVFRRREADLHNLVPVLGLLNQARGTLPFGTASLSTPDFMGCPLKIDRRKGIVEPAPAIRGTIARAHLYMRDRHGIKLSYAEQLTYEQWHRQYPPDAWEIKWDHRIQAVQGHHNPYIHKGNRPKKSAMDP